MIPIEIDPDARSPREPVVAWLLDADPSIRWQVMRDFMRAPDPVVAAERARVAAEGWGAELLARQRPDGAWGDDIRHPIWSSTLHTMLRLRDLGLDPAGAQARAAVGRLRNGFTWGPEFGDTPFFEGEVEPCINGGVLALGAYFGEASDRLLDRLLGEQLADGGWNCEAERGSVRSSFHTTICVLEGLLGYERSREGTAAGSGTRVEAATAARARAHAYLLERRMLRRLSTGEVIDPSWMHLAFPTTWHYDVLRGLDYLRDAGVAPDARVAEAVEIVARKARDGRWPLDVRHRDPAQLDMEGGVGEPSRWVTLRALRVLGWYDAARS